MDLKLKRLVVAIMLCSRLGFAGDEKSDPAPQVWTVDAIEPTAAKPAADGGAAQTASSTPATPKVESPNGIDPVVHPGRVDSALFGYWQISIPPSKQVNTATQLGILNVHGDGSYEWMVPGQQRSRGGLIEVTPRQGATPGVRYWSAQRGNETYYFSVDGDQLTVYSPATNGFVAQGQRG